jgi:dephospho-CoA kinase
MQTLGFTGMPWSGKSEAVAFADEKGFPVFRMGDFIWDEVKKRKLPMNASTVGSVASDMRKKYGSTIWAERTVEAIEKVNDSSIVVIDGIRSISEVNYFRRHLSDSFRLVAIIASDKIRHQRAKKRGRVDDSSDDQSIKRRDNREIQWGIEQVINESDIKISNELSLVSFRKKITNLYCNELIDESID